MNVVRHALRPAFTEISHTFVISTALTDADVPMARITMARIVFPSKTVLVNIINKCFLLDPKFKTIAMNGKKFKFRLYAVFKPCIQRIVFLRQAREGFFFTRTAAEGRQS